MTELRKVTQLSKAARYYRRHREKILAKSRAKYAETRDAQIKKAREWQKEHPDRVVAYRKKTLTRQNERRRTKRFRTQRNESRKLRKQSDVAFRLKCAMRSRLGTIMRSKATRKTKSTMDMLGCSALQLKQHIERQWLPGMSWDNYGLFGWHIDHIIPLSAAESTDDLLTLFHYTNLRPLWAQDNLQKSNKVA